MALDSIEGEPVIWESRMYEEAPSGLISMIRQAAGEKIIYALTETKAYILSSRGKEVLQSCEINGVTVSIIRRIKVGRGNLEEVGDVLFIKQGRVLMKFIEVEKPDNFVKIFNAKKVSEMKLPTPAPTDETLPISNKSIEQNETSLDNSEGKTLGNEIWRFGPVIRSPKFLWTPKEDAMSMTEIIFKNFRESFTGRYVKVFYLITRQKAMVVDAKDETKVYAEVNIDECEMVVQNTRMVPAMGVYKSYGGRRRDILLLLLLHIRPRNKVIIGDILFLCGGVPGLSFGRVPDPEKVVENVKSFLKTVKYK